MSRKQVVSTEVKYIPAKAEGHLMESFVFIRLWDGKTESWIVLPEDDYNAIKNSIVDWGNG